MLPPGTCPQSIDARPRFRAIDLLRKLPAGPTEPSSAPEAIDMEVGAVSDVEMLPPGTGPQSIEAPSKRPRFRAIDLLRKLPAGPTEPSPAAEDVDMEVGAVSDVAKPEDADLYSRFIYNSNCRLSSRTMKRSWSGAYDSEEVVLGLEELHAEQVDRDRGLVHEMDEDHPVFVSFIFFP